MPEMPDAGVVIEELPEKLDLTNAPEVQPPPAPEPKLDPLSSAGVVLAKWVLVILSISILLLVAVLIFGEVHHPYDSLLAQVHAKQTQNLETKELEFVVEKMLESQKAFREFWMQLAQMILLNLLLPVLTAILGYVFGSKRS